VLTDMSRMKPVAAVVAALVAGSALTGCEGANEGDCNARITFQDATYRTHNLTKSSTPTHRSSTGVGDVVGCDGEPVDRVEVYQIQGVDLDIAIAVVDSDWQGLYVLEGTTPEDWPLIRQKVS
jgi:hypothetical protein